MKKNTNVLLLFILLSLSSCSSKDIRPKNFIKNGISSVSKEQENRASNILDKMYLSYGGYDLWLNYRSAKVTYTDHWDAWIPKLFNAPYDDNIKVQYSFLLRTFNSRMLFLEGKSKGVLWGLQNWAPYIKGPENKLKFRDHFKTKFHLAARQFFFELPFILDNFKIKSFLGEERIKGIHYYKVFFSDSYKNSSRSDQFIAFINSKTYHLEILYYTIRELGRHFSGANHFSDFRTVQGLTLPFQSIIHWKPGGESIVHRFKILNIKFKNEKATNISDFYPDPGVKKDYYQYF